MRSILLFLLMMFFAPYTGLAQSVDYSYYSIGIAPFGLLDPITPSLNIAAEMHIMHTDKSDIHLEFTYGLDLLDGGSFWLPEDSEFHHPAPEGRHHEYKLGLKTVSRSTTNYRIFLGLEYFGLIDEYLKSNDSYISTDRRFSYSSTQVNRTINGFRLKLGPKIKYKSMEIELYGGIGAKNIDIVYSNVKDKRAFTLSNLIDVFIIDEKEGSRIRPDFNFGIKLSYLIKSP